MSTWSPVTAGGRYDTGRVLMEALKRTWVATFALVVRLLVSSCHSGGADEVWLGVLVNPETVGGASIAKCRDIVYSGPVSHCASRGKCRK